jgi:hypothetical protein
LAFIKISHFVQNDIIEKQLLKHYTRYKFKGDSWMNDRRKYQRDYINNDGDMPAHIEIRLEGFLVRLADFSLGGLCVLSERPFSPGVIRVSVEFGDRGKLDLTGSVVRMNEEGDMWRIAIDLSETYKLSPS